jgi:hypothetical protein
VIGSPVNDRSCMGSISEVVQELVDHQDLYVTQIAREHPTTDSLVTWIRSLPQRDDLGDPKDGPKVDQCSPVQRLRIPAQDPNCVERAALYIAVAELIDPSPLRQLMTIDTPDGLHTLPIENGKAVILNPTLTRNCVDCGIALHECGLTLQEAGPIPVHPRDAIELTSLFAEVGAEELRNDGGNYQSGPSPSSQVKQGKTAIVRLMQEGEPPKKKEVEAMALLLALAERVAERYGRRALVLVRSTSRAIADLAEEVLVRSQRNLSLQIGGYRLRPTAWASALARLAATTGASVGMTALQAKLMTMGVPPSLLESVERELKNQGFNVRTLSPSSEARPWSAKEAFA